MKILVIDDHVLIRESLQGVLREWQRDAAILEASDCRQAMQLGAYRPRAGSARLEFAGRRRLPRARRLAGALSSHIGRRSFGEQ